jgi:DNA-binding PadR family transcriptional regulator
MEPLTTREIAYAMRLRERDRKIMSYIAQNQFAPVKILRDLFWDGKKDRTDYRRLKQLSQKGLVEPLSSDRNFELCYRLTEKGSRLMKETGLAPIFYGKANRNYGTSFEHDRKLQFIRQVLESAPCISNFCPEPEVRKILAERHGIQQERDQRYKVPDAIFNLQLPDRKLRVALELELSAKSMKRTKRLMELLGTSPDFDSTFFVVGSDKLMVRLLQALSEARKTNQRMKHHGKDHGFYFISLSQLLDKKQEALFVGEDTKFSLSQLSREQNIMPTQMPTQMPKTSAFEK